MSLLELEKEAGYQGSICNHRLAGVLQWAAKEINSLQWELDVRTQTLLRQAVSYDHLFQQTEILRRFVSEVASGYHGDTPPFNRLRDTAQVILDQFKQAEQQVLGETPCST